MTPQDELPTFSRRAALAGLMGLAGCDSGGLQGVRLAQNDAAGGNTREAPAAAAVPAAPPGPPKPVGSAAETRAFNLALGRGVNIGNALEAPQEGRWGVRLTSELFDRSKQAGVQTIRLPVRWSNHALPHAPYSLHEEFARRVDFAIDESLKRGIRIVVNMHHYRQLDGQSVDGRKDKSYRLDDNEFEVAPMILHERFKAMWRHIAERYKGRPIDSVLFELNNEPNYAMTPEIWNRLAAETIAVIRESNPDRYLVVPSINWLPSLAKLKLPETDQRLIVDVHNYETLEFTHQQLEWTEPRWPRQRFGEHEKRKIVAALELIADWRRANDRPVWIGEFGVSTTTDAPERAAYARFSRDEMEKRGFFWAYWDQEAGFGYYDPKAGQWFPGMKEALFGP